MVLTNERYQFEMKHFCLSWAAILFLLKVLTWLTTWFVVQDHLGSCSWKPFGKKGRHFHVIIVRLLDELLMSIIGQHEPIKSNHLVIPLLPKPIKRQVKTSCPLRKKPFRVILSCFFQWNILSGSDITDDTAASTLTSSGAPVAVQTAGHFSLWASYLNHDPHRCQQVHMGQKLVWANCLLRATSA